MMLIHGTSALIDAAVAVTLASSALFSVNPGEARSSILLSLVGTMAPFVLLAPSASLLVEKIHFPRIVVAITINAFRLLGLILMAMASSHSSSTRLAIFPLAFVMLTLSKCYVVAKTSALPQITTTANFPYFSSRLSMTTGILSVVAGSLFFSVNSVISESGTLFFAAGIATVAVVISIMSYRKIHQRYQLSDEYEVDCETSEADAMNANLSSRNRGRAIVSLFMYVSGIRFAVGAATVGIGLTFREDKFILGLCFLVAVVASYITNIVAVKLSRSRIALIVNYFFLGALCIAALWLLASSSSIFYIALSAVLGSLGAYSRVVYESRAAHIIPLEFSARILSRGEVWMQFSWVLGALCSVISYSSVFLGLLCFVGSVFSIRAYAATMTALSSRHSG